ncbi:MAG: pyridoxamine 5'-phosphate oxidase family protein [Actinomycetota bacterium]
MTEDPSPADLFADVDSLEACVGTRPAGSHLKSIPYLDEHCHTLLAASPFALVGHVDAGGAVHTTAIGGDAGVLAPKGDAAVTLPRLGLADGAAIGVLSFVPGYRETLRVNGRFRAGDSPRLQVEEAFLHCAKALIRSTFWSEPATTHPPDVLATGTTDLANPAVTTFFEACPFVALSSVDAAGNADVSPKGDPAGMVAQVVDGRTVAIADRPGNRRTDTMHNLVENDAIGLLAMIPGRTEVIEVRGRAGVTADEAIRARFAVAGKIPNAAIVIDPDHVEVRV